MSSLGIKRASSRALSQAAANNVRSKISSIGLTESETFSDPAASKEKAILARSAYSLLGSYGRSLVDNYDTLKRAEELLGIETDDAAEHGSASQGSSQNSGKDGSSDVDIYKTGRLSDTYYTLQDKIMSSVCWEAFRDKGITGKDVVIAVLDSGLTGSHQDLDYSRILEGKDLIAGGKMIDSNGHGTAVTGIIQATADNGIGIL